MDFKLFSLCLGLVAVVRCASSVPEEKVSVAKYTMKLSKDGKEYDGEIEIDTKKGTETFHVPKAASNEEPGDVVYDFKRGLTLIRLPDVKSCFLSNSTDDVPKPAELVKLLENSERSGFEVERSRSAINLTVVGVLQDRSELSDEMAELCAKLPIYIVAEGDLDPSDEDQVAVEAEDETAYIEKLSAKRVKRGWGRIRIRRVKPVLKWVCRNVCKYKCYKYCNVICYNVCKRHCSRVCGYIG